MADFKLQLERLSEIAESFTFEVTSGWWNARETESASAFCAVDGPFVFRLAARRVGDEIGIDGDFSGRIDLECSRCAKRYPRALREAFRLVLEPAKGDEPTDPEGQRALSQEGLCLGGDLEAGWYRGPVIRLGEFFAEVIALAVPIQPLCFDQCPGICAHCGVDLAETQCSCEDEKIESPFAVLAQLKGGAEES
ncbi:MAG: hypothetical protein CL908_13025 [Deltaproteobacteria bacterium]|nr:hypothetical protein [Deltaproteobacteria bacterium]